MRKHWLVTGTLAGVASFGAPGAYAQDSLSGLTADESGNSSGDIVVTANRRSESVQDVAGAVTAIPQGELEARGIDNFEGFARSVPGLSMFQPTRNRAVFNIRGIATTTLGGNTQDPVSVYINDTPVTDTYGAAAQPDLRLFDVERVEVLRGPQGTLFGSGSLGGTIRIITNKPDASGFDAEGRLDVGVTKGGGVRQRYDAMVNVPLATDTLALRAVGYYRNEEGWVHNTNLGVRNDTVDWGGRVALRWIPSPDLTVSAEVFHQNSDPDDADGWNPALGKFTRATSVSEARPNNLTNYNFSVNYDFANFATLTSTTTYQRSTTAQISDNGDAFGLGLPVVSVADPWTSRFFVQEVRLVSNTSSPFEWVFGGFYIKRKTSIPSFLINLAGLDQASGGVVGSDAFFDTSIATGSTELAAYGDVSYEIAEGLKLRGGLRVFRTTTKYVETERRVLDFATLSYFPPESFDNRASNTNTTWRVGLSYEPGPNLLFYGNVSKGFRVGQVNSTQGPSLVDPADIVIPEGYKPDTTINYEIGAKTNWLDGAVTLNLTGFYIEWKNIQIDAQRVSDLRNFIANAGRASVRGVEFEAAARPARGVNIYATVTVQDGHIDSLPTNIIVPTAPGETLPGLAKWKLAGGMEYRWDVGPESEIYARLDGQFTDRSPAAFSNNGTNPFYALNDEYASLDASIGYDADWGSVAVYGENLTNNGAIILRNLTSPNSYYTLRPVTAGVRVTMRY